MYRDIDIVTSYNILVGLISNLFIFIFEIAPLTFRKNTLGSWSAILIIENSHSKYMYKELVCINIFLSISYTWWHWHCRRIEIMCLIVLINQLLSFIRTHEIYYWYIEWNTATMMFRFICSVIIPFLLQYRRFKFLYLNSYQMLILCKTLLCYCCGCRRAAEWVTVCGLGLAFN